MLTVVASGTQLTFHQLQDIYNSLTGKTESITQLFEGSPFLKFEDLAQLNARINQAFDSYGASIKNTSITVYHVDGLKEVFSSFDRFKLYNKSNTSPVENVSIEYHFLIIPAGSDEPRKYRIHVDLPSRVGIWEKRPDFSVGPVSISRMFSSLPPRVIIEYVDYAAARHFLAQITEWFDSLDSSPERVWLQKAQGISHWLRELFPSASVLFVLLVFYAFVNQGLHSDLGGNEIIEFLCLVSAFAVSAWMFGKVFGRLTEWGIDRVQPLSYVSLNRGDEKCVQKRMRRNTTGGFVSIVSFLAYLAFNYLISIAAAFSVENWF